MKKYFIWKDANCNGINPEWLEITGQEFRKLKKENPERRFIISYDEDDPESDRFLFEATRKDYNEWNRDHMRYVRHNKQLFENYVVVSLDELLDEDDDEGLTLGDIIPDTSDDDAAAEDAYNEWRALLIEALRESIKELKPLHRETLDLLYINNPKSKSIKAIAEEAGIPRKTLNDRNTSLVKKMKSLIEKKVATFEKRV